MNKSKKSKKSQRKGRTKLKLFEEVVQVPVIDGYMRQNVTVVVLAADRNEALQKVHNRKWWKKSGLRPTGEFR